MQRTGFTAALAHRAATRPWTTVALWALLLVVMGVLGGGLGDVVTEDSELLVETEADRAAALIDEARTAAGQQEPPTEYVILAGQGTRVDDPGFTTAVDELVADLSALENVTAVIPPGPGAVSEDGTVALIVTHLTDDDSETSAPLVDVVAAADEAAANLRIVTVGQGSVNAEFTALAEETLQRGELLGLPAALAILLVVFGAVVAALVPLGLALVAIVVAVGLTFLVGQVTDLNMFVLNMITMIGLAVGIDYTLFVVQRYREERAAGRATVEAVVTAGATASRAVFFSGMTVVIALLGMMFMPETTMRSLGLGAIVVVLASVLAALTLLPAVLTLLGDRINRLRVPFTHRDTDTAHRFWTRITRVVTARPVVSVLLAGGLLVGLAVPYLDISLGSNFIAALPEDSDARFGFETLTEDLQGGLVSTPIAISGDTSDPAVRAATADLVAALEADAVYGDVTVAPGPDGDLLVVTATSRLDPSTDAARDAVATLRDTTVPATFAGVDAEVLVTGDAAWISDMVDVITGRTPTVFAFVLGLSFLLLMLAFRSIVVPLKAIVMNLLSVGATYGVLVLVFQRGVGADLLGFRTTDVIEAWVPLFLFAVLFGLSMDYHVFLLSRIKERYVATGDNTGSVAHGLSATGAIITGAALIMVAVFGGFAAGDLVMFQQMGLGLAVAVILDATLVRSVLVPATMELLGDRNWYFPTWLDWLPHLRIEGPGPADGLDGDEEEPLVLPEVVPAE